MYHLIRRQRPRVIDFTFERNGKIGMRWLNVINRVKERLSTQSSEIFGRVVPEDDAVVLPLQAADLIASKVRRRLATPSEHFSESLQGVFASGKLVHYQYRDKELDEYMAGMAEAFRGRRMVRGA